MAVIWTARRKFILAVGGLALLAGVMCIHDEDGNTGWMVVTGHAKPPIVKTYSGRVTAIDKQPFKNFFGSTAKMFIGVQLDAGNYQLIECLDGMTGQMQECFGLQPGARVLVYWRESGKPGIRR